MLRKIKVLIHKSHNQVNSKANVWECVTKSVEYPTSTKGPGSVHHTAKTRSKAHSSLFNLTTPQLETEGSEVQVCYTASFRPVKTNKPNQKAPQPNATLRGKRKMPFLQPNPLQNKNK